MKIINIIWHKYVVEKLDWKHSLVPEEVEELFANRPRYRLQERGKVQGEDVYAAYGQTNAGRYLTVIFIRKLGGKALIISARDMDKRERKRYG